MILFSTKSAKLCGYPHFQSATLERQHHAAVHGLAQVVAGDVSDVWQLLVHHQPDQRRGAGTFCRQSADV